MLERPPHNTTSALNSPSQYDSIMEEKINSINDRYLYWSDVKYKKDIPNLSTEELWTKIQEARRKHDVKIWPDYGMHFSLTNKMQRMCHEFDLNFGGSWGAMRLFPQDKINRELYLISSVMEEAISSSQMEGASTTREAAKEMLRKDMKPRDRSQRMILNNYQTIQFISTNKHEPLTPALFLHIHELMTNGTLENSEDACKLRTNDNIVVSNNITGEIVHRPPESAKLPAFVEELCVFFNNNTSQSTFLHPIIKGLIIHFLVAYYHPFVDGNGRTARALFYWFMLKENYWLVEYLSISRIIYKTKNQYEKSFLYTENDNNDLGYFITYNLDVLAKAFDGLKKYLQKKQAERKRADQFMHIDGVSYQQSEIIRIFYEEGVIALEAKDIARLFNVSRVTAKSYLDGLVSKGILKRLHPDGRTHAYVKSDNFVKFISS